MTSTYALFGDPVSRSLSPAFQNAGFAAANLSARYLTRVASSRAELEAGAAAMRLGELSGANVTLPAKRWALELADAATPLAEVVGAANTWFMRDTQLQAANTDVAGVIATLEAFELVSRRVVIFGAGGAARAAAVALRGRFDVLTIVNRTIAPACELAGDLCAASEPSTRVTAAAWGSGPARAACGEADLLIDATSLAHLAPATAERAWAGCTFDHLQEGAAAFSLSYGSGTAPLDAALPAHVRHVDGLTMLLHQGARSFSLWTGQDAPLGAMRDALAAAAGCAASSIPLWPAIRAADA